MSFSAFLDEVRLFKSLPNTKKLDHVGIFNIHYQISDKTTPTTTQGIPFGWDYVEPEPLELKTVFDIVKEVAEASTYMLSGLGFGSKRVNLLLTDELKKMTNPYTGGSVGGLANFKDHGITMSLRDFQYLRKEDLLHILNHEVAHMYWKELPKASKEYFNKWFYDNVSKGVNAFRSNQWKAVFENPDRRNEVFKELLQAKKQSKSLEEFNQLVINILFRFHISPKTNPALLYKLNDEQFIKKAAKLVDFDNQDYTDIVHNSLTKPEFDFLRSIATQLGVTPSNYSAVNSMELWAETIAHLAKRSQIYPNLKKLVIDLIR